VSGNTAQEGAAHAATDAVVVGGGLEADDLAAGFRHWAAKIAHEKIAVNYLCRRTTFEQRLAMVR